jgi:hypothetical protein
MVALDLGLATWLIGISPILERISSVSEGFSSVLISACAIKATNQHHGKT